MTYRIKIQIFVLLVASLFSCKARVADSNVHGSFEEGNMKALNAASGKQKYVPEFLPTKAVLVSSEILQDWALDDTTALFNALAESGSEIWILTDDEHDSRARLNKKNLPISTNAAIHLVKVATDSVWIRDYGPLPTRAVSGGYVFINTNYNTENQNDENVPINLAKLLGAGRLSIPVFFSFGYLACNSVNCYVGRSVAEDDKNATEGDGRAYSEEQIAAMMSIATGNQVTMMNPLPYENTGHMDLWAQFVAEKTIFVIEIPDDSEKYFPGSMASSLGWLKEMREHLDDAAKKFTADGYTVVRIPSPVPLREGTRTVMRSYVNSLLINGNAILPRYKKKWNGKNYEDYPDAANLQKYESIVQKLYDTQGYKVHWVDFDYFVTFSGALHCVTLTLPKL